MKIKECCSNCGSENIQGLAWVGLNNNKDIDFSASESGDSDDFWCTECKGHYKPISRKIYELNDEVYWNDPENEISGNYKIVRKITEDGEYSVYLVANGFSEVEVYEYELS